MRTADHLGERTAIFAFHRGRARCAGASAPRAGAVSFVLWFGGPLNLNVHFHCVIPDGVLSTRTARSASSRCRRRPRPTWRRSSVG
ncbi:MAG: transposase, partial [Myxococcales bacterium]